MSDPAASSVSSNTFKEPASKRPRSDQSSSTSLRESNSEGRRRIEDIKEKEKHDQLGFLGLVSELEKMAIKKSVAKDMIETRKKLCKDAFAAIKKGFSHEKDLQQKFNELMEKIFQGSDLSWMDTSRKEMDIVPGVTKKDRKPDITIYNGPTYWMTALMVIELKTNFKLGNFIDAFAETRDHALDLLVGSGCFAPRKEFWAITSTGARFFFYKFFFDSDQFKHIQFSLSPEQALCVLIDIAHFYSFEELKFPVQIQDKDEEINLMDPHMLSSLRSVFINDRTAIYRIRLSLLSCYVVKLNKHPHCQENINSETVIYKKLNENSDVLSTLRLIGHYNSQINNKSALVFGEFGHRVKTFQEIHKVVDVLKVLHTSGYVHRDVRPANFLEVVRGGKKQTLLIDFGFSCKSDKEEQYSGTMETASDDVLRQLQEGKSHVKVEPKDDLESLVKSFFLLCFNPDFYMNPLLELAKKELGRKERAKKILENWCQIKNSTNTKKMINDIWVSAKDCNYDLLKQKIEEIENGFFKINLQGKFKT